MGRITSNHISNINLLDNWVSSDLTDGETRTTTPNYGGIGSIPRWRWWIRYLLNPIVPNPHAPTWNLLEPTNWLVKMTEYKSMSPQSLQYGPDMNFSPPQNASANGVSIISQIKG